MVVGKGVGGPHDVNRMLVGVGDESARCICSTSRTRVGGDGDGLHGWLRDETAAGGGDGVENSLGVRLLWGVV